MFVAALASGKVDVTYGSIRPKVEVPACLCDPYRLHQEGREGCRRLQFNRIDRKAHDRLGNLRQQGQDAYNKCFSQRAPQQPSFAEATKQASVADRGDGEIAPCILRNKSRRFDTYLVHRHMM